MKHTLVENMFNPFNKRQIDDCARYRGPLTPLQQLERIAANEDGEDLLVWGSGTGTKVWRWITVGPFVLSVQGSSSHYCEPRFSDGPYSALEVQVYEGQTPLHWEQWNTDPENSPGYGPYSEVPVEEIRKLIEGAEEVKS
jgi:hypothetical protein